MACFFDTMLIMPPVPSESYFASGLVTMSILCTLATGMLPSPSSDVGTPSTKNRTLPLPRMDTCPLLSMLTEGDPLSTSSTEPVAALIVAAGLMRVFSMVMLFAAVLPETTTPSNCVDFCVRTILPTSVNCPMGMWMVFMASS